jgi:hypothetical protein
MANVSVKILQQSGRSVLVEWRDEYGAMRGTLPLEVVKDGFVDDKHLSLAIPYGVDWVYALQTAMPEVTPERFAATLRQYDIWTFEDLTSNSQRAFTAIQAVYGLDYQTLVKVAKSYNTSGG